jgi:group I intron endonuclease
MGIYTIYKATNKINGKSYVGFDSKWPRRKKQHEKSSFNKNNSAYTGKFHYAIRKYGIINFDWEIIYQSKDGNHCLTEMEFYFIKEYNTFNNGYNMTFGGDGVLGYIMSEKSKQKISKNRKGKKQSEELKKRRSVMMLGKNNPMFGKTNKGYKHTEEHKKYITEKNSNDWTLINPQGKKYHIKNLRRFCLDNNLCQSSMIFVSQGKQLNHKGWKCSKKDI